MKKVFVNSLPKAGTNLMAKALNSMGLNEKFSLGAHLILNDSILAKCRRLLWRPFNQGYLLGIDTPIEVSKKIIDRKIHLLKQGEFATAHIGYTSNLLEKILEEEIAAIVIIRDPRAVLSSFVNYVCSRKEHIHNKFLTFKDDVEKYKTALYGGQHDQCSLQPLRVRCESLSQWVLNDKVLTIRFEDLVGAKGGGSDESQFNAINCIAEHIGVEGDNLEEVCGNLFGEGRHTFRKGQIDSWKNEIPPSLSINIENELGHILKEWGYVTEC
jgi:hypothetical protein